MIAQQWGIYIAAGNPGLVPNSPYVKYSEKLMSTEPVDMPVSLKVLYFSVWKNNIVNIIYKYMQILK